MTWQEDSELIQIYHAALKEMWKLYPNKETQGRFSGYERSARLARLNWIRWVQQNAKRIEWCGQLVACAVTCRLTNPN